MDDTSGIELGRSAGAARSGSSNFGYLDITGWELLSGVDQYESASVLAHLPGQRIRLEFSQPHPYTFVSHDYALDQQGTLTGLPLAAIGFDLENLHLGLATAWGATNAGVMMHLEVVKLD